MSEKQFFVLAHQEARRRAMHAVQNAPGGFSVTVGPLTRTLAQNAVQWPILEAFSQQLQWPVNSHMETLTSQEFKEVFTAAFTDEEVRLAAGLNGGVVMLGHRTSEFDKREFSDWIEFLRSIAAQRGVVVYEDER